MVWDHGLNPTLSAVNPMHQGFSLCPGAPFLDSVSPRPEPKSGFRRRSFDQKYPQYCWEFHDQLWKALSGTNSEKKRRPQPYWGERILETLWKPQMPWIIAFGAFQPYSRGKFQETLWERFRGLSGIFPEFLPESPSRTGGMAHLSQRSFWPFWTIGPVNLPALALWQASQIPEKSSRSNAGPKAGYQRRKIHPNTKGHLNKFLWAISVRFLTRVTGKKAKVRASFSKKFAWTRCFVGILGFGVGFWASRPLK